MEFFRRLERLIDANAALWGGEAEVFRAYWDWARRTPATDRLWLSRQAYKEYWDGFAPPLERLHQGASRAVDASSRAAALEDARTACEELAHYSAFAEAYEALRGPEDPPLDPLALRAWGSWEENDALMRLRAAHKREQGELGERAHRFTEGGYCTLYAEGRKLAGRGGADEAISLACARVFEQEFGHMLKGIADLDRVAIGDDGWDTLTRMTVEQSRLRILMRNAQFSYPLSPGRVEELCSGVAEPGAFC